MIISYIRLWYDEPFVAFIITAIFSLSVGGILLVVFSDPPEWECLDETRSSYYNAATKTTQYQTTCHVKMRKGYKHKVLIEKNKGASDDWNG